MRVLVSLFVLLMVSGLFFVGCGKQDVSSGAASVTQEDMRQQKLADFNEKLGNIEDEETAAQAIGALEQHLYGNKEGRVSIFSAGAMNKLVKLELKARKKGVYAQDTSTAEALTPEKVAEAFNQSMGSQVISAEVVQDVSAAVRQELPNIRSADPENIAPTEALTAGYVIATGDTGQAEPGTFADFIPQEKAAGFVENLTEQAGEVQ